MSGGVDMSPKRSSCSTGWMSRRNRNILYLSSYYDHYNRDIIFNVSLQTEQGFLLGSFSLRRPCLARQRFHSENRKNTGGWRKGEGESVWRKQVLSNSLPQPPRCHFQPVNTGRLLMITLIFFISRGMCHFTSFQRNVSRCDSLTEHREAVLTFWRCTHTVFPVRRPRWPNAFLS